MTIPMRTKHKDARFLGVIAVMVVSLLAVTIIASAGSVIIKNGGLNVSSNFYVDPTTGLVGVGTTSPVGKLYVYGSSPTDFGPYDTPLVVKGGTYSYIYINGTSNQSGIIYLRDSSTGFLTSFNNAGDFRLAPTSGLGQMAITNAKDGSVGITILNNSGNVGIGTASPGEKIHVKNGNIYLQNITVQSSTNSVISVIGSQIYDVRSLPASFANIEFLTGNPWYTGQIVFKTNPSDGTNPASPPVERMRIDQNGNVGIGTTSPNEKIEILEGRLRLSHFGDANPSLVNAVKFVQGRGTASSPSSSISGDVLGAVDYYGMQDATPVIGARIDAITEANWGVSNHVTTLRFMTAQDTFDAVRMVIKSNGNVGIGTTSPQNTLNVVGDINATGTIYGTLRSGGTPAGTLTNLTNVASSRTCGNVYRNTFGYTMVIIAGTYYNNAVATVTSYTDGSNPPTTTWDATQTQGNRYSAVTNMLVQNNNYYKISGCNGINYWLEGILT